jgi:putative glutamine amidotransferase
MPRPLIGITAHHRNSDEGHQDVIGLMQFYVDAVRDNGGLPVILPLGLNDEDFRELYDRLDGIVMSGGGDMQPELCGAEPHESIYGLDPERDHDELNLVRWAVSDDKPILGICRGAQVFNVALGGTLYGDIASHAPNDPLKHNWFPGFPRNKIAHPVAVTEETKLAKIMGAPIVEVNSLHHQAIHETGAGLEVAARAPDGIVEAVELPNHRFALGVQWHPECLQDRPEMRALFSEFIKAAN